MSDNVTRYYDANTRRFLRHGQGGSSLAIHRAVWAPGVESRREAMEYINARSAEEARRLAAGRVLDIGCGVGGTLLYLATRVGAEATGITLSKAQERIGNQLLRERGCPERCRIVAGDFLDPAAPELLGGPFELALAVEAYLHMPDPAAFFRSAARVTARGGSLLLCDDFVSLGAERQPRTARLLRRFRRGWHARGLSSPEESRRYAEEAGFSLAAEEDLTPYLELGRPRDRLIRLLVGLTAPLPLNSPFWQNLRGGDALQRLLADRSISYRLLRFTRR
jgi:cyclopropane fatty-acyl-phospholipid synthase-like methyltransferase